MKYVVDLPDRLYARVASLMQTMGLASLSQVVQAALENQLELEASEEGALREGTGSIGHYAETSVSARVAPWEGIRLDDLTNVDGEIRQPRGGTGFLMQLAHGELPAPFLLPGMFAGDAVKPAFDAAGKQEIILVDGQHPTLHQDAVV